LSKHGGKGILKGEWHACGFSLSLSHAIKEKRVDDLCFLNNPKVIAIIVVLQILDQMM